MPDYDNDHLGSLRAALLDHSIYTNIPAAGALYGAKNNARLRHFIYYTDRHIELDGDSQGPMERELLSDLTATSPHRGERPCKPRAAASRLAPGFGTAY
jgi:hypothetical protein